MSAALSNAHIIPSVMYMVIFSYFSTTYSYSFFIIKYCMTKFRINMIGNRILINWTIIYVNVYKSLNPAVFDTYIFNIIVATTKTIKTTYKPIFVILFTIGYVAFMSNCLLRRYIISNKK